VGVTGRKKLLAAALLCISSVWLLVVAPAAAGVRERVETRGHVVCGVDHSPGFSGFDEMGRPRGFEVDFCRAIAAAVLGDAERFRTLRISTSTKFQALLDGEIDLALGMSTWTFGRDTNLGVRFVAPIFYDGQGFMVWEDSPFSRSNSLRGARVCVQEGTTSAANLRDHDRQHDLNLTIIATTSSDDRINRFVRRECDLMTGDRTELATRRVASTLDTTRWRLLDLVISREPLGPYIIDGDSEWFALVRWAILVTQIAETRGIVSARHLNTVGATADTELRRLAGLDPDFGKSLALDPAWARRIIEQVGSYGEIFERHLGTQSPYGFDRGPNRPATQGGWFFPPPLR